MRKREHWWEKSKLYYVSIIITLMLSYGFSMTHFSIGIDDEAFGYYFNQGGLIQQGRVQSYILMKFINIDEYLPIWRELIGLLLMTMGIMILGHLFYKLSGERFGSYEEIIFSCTAISFPYIASLFAFSMSVVSWGLGYLVPAVIVSLLLDKDFVRNGVCRWGCLGVITALGMLDEQIIVNTGTFFLSSLVIIFFYFEGKECHRARRFIVESGKALGILVFGLCSRVVIVTFIQKIENIQPNNYTRSYIEYDFSKGLKEFFWKIFEVLKKWFYNSTSDDVILLFRLFVVLVLSMAIWGLIKKRNIIFFGLSFALIIAAIIWPLITGKMYLYNRVMVYMGVTLGFGIAFFFHILLQSSARYKKVILTVLGVVCIYIIVNQTQYINRVFLAEYTCCEKDRRIIEKIGEDLKAYKKKGVIFVGFPEGAVQYDAFVDTKSLFYVDRYDSIENEINGARLFWDFNLYGYSINQGPHADIKEVIRETNGMKNYPTDGYIKETSKYIIVKLGDAPWEQVHFSEENMLYNQDSVLCSIDAVTVDDTNIYVNGWALIKGEVSSKNKYFVVLENDRGIYKLRTQQVERLDVTEAFGNSINYDMSGFVVNSNICNYLESGDYSIKVIMEKDDILYVNDIKTITIK